MRLERNFYRQIPSRTEQKRLGNLGRTAMDSNDELKLIERVEKRAADIDNRFPGLGKLAAKRLNVLFGAGQEGIGGLDPKTMSGDLEQLSVRIVGKEQERVVYRGMELLSYEINAIKRNVNSRNIDDNHAAAYILMHGYTKQNGKKNYPRPPSVSSLLSTAQVYASDPGRSRKSVMIKLILSGSSGRNSAAKGVTFTYQQDASGGENEIILSPSNTYYIRKYTEGTHCDEITMSVTGSSEAGDRAIARSLNPLDRAATSPQADALYPLRTAGQRSGRTNAGASRQSVVPFPQSAPRPRDMRSEQRSRSDSLPGLPAGPAAPPPLLPGMRPVRSRSASRVQPPNLQPAPIYSAPQPRQSRSRSASWAQRTNWQPAPIYAAPPPVQTRSRSASWSQLPTWQPVPAYQVTSFAQPQFGTVNWAQQPRWQPVQPVQPVPTYSMTSLVQPRLRSASWSQPTVWPITVQPAPILRSAPPVQPFLMNRQPRPKKPSLISRVLRKLSLRTS